MTYHTQPWMEHFDDPSEFDTDHFESRFTPVSETERDPENERILTAIVQVDAARSRLRKALSAGTKAASVSRARAFLREALEGLEADDAS